MLCLRMRWPAGSRAIPSRIGRPLRCSRGRVGSSVMGFSALVWCGIYCRAATDWVATATGSAQRVWLAGFSHRSVATATDASHKLATIKVQPPIDRVATATGGRHWHFTKLLGRLEPTWRNARTLPADFLFDADAEPSEVEARLERDLLGPFEVVDDGDAKFLVVMDPGDAKLARDLRHDVLTSPFSWTDDRDEG
jgi:hypothetical protein